MIKVNGLILPFLLLLSSCGQNGYESGNSVRLARAGSDYLTLREARGAIPDFVLQQDSIQAIIKYRKEWIRQQILLQKAKNMQLAEQPRVQQRLRKAHNEVFTTALREVVLSKYEANAKIDDQEALQYYKKHKEQFVLNERHVKFRHVSTENIEFARAARQELLSGTPWPKVARLYSDQAEQRIRQSQKFWPLSAVLNDNPILEQYIASLDSGGISPPRRINGVYHFVQLTGARGAGEFVKPERVLGELKKWIMLEKKRQFFKSYVKNLYLEAKQHNEIELYNVLNNESKTDTADFN